MATLPHGRKIDGFMRHWRSTLLPRFGVGLRNLLLIEVVLPDRIANLLNQIKDQEDPRNPFAPR